MKARLDSPEQFEELLSPFAGKFKVEPPKRSKFHSSVQPVQLDRLGLFTVTANSIAVAFEANHRFFSITHARGLPFNCKVKSGMESFAPGTAHVLQPWEKFQLSVRDDCRVLVFNVLLKSLQDYLKRIYHLDKNPDISTPARLNSTFPEGISLKRALARTWAKLQLESREVPAGIAMQKIGMIIATLSPTR